MGVVANCDHTSEWVHRVRACIWIAMGWVMLRKSLLAFLLPVCKMQFCLYQLSTTFQVARSMWLLTIHCSFHPSSVLLVVAICGIQYAQLTMFPMLETYIATSAGVVFSCLNFGMRSKLAEFWCIVVSARANLYSTKATYLFRSLILNSHCSCHGRCPFKVL